MALNSHIHIHVKSFHEFKYFYFSKMFWGFFLTFFFRLQTQLVNFVHFIGGIKLSVKQK